MRFLKILVVIVLVAGAGLVGLTYWRSTSFHAALPAIAPAAPLPPLAVSASTIIVPVEIRLDAIARHLNGRIRRGGSESQQNFARDLLADDQLSFSWTRGDLALSGDGGVLTMSAPLGGNMRAEGRLAFARVAGTAEIRGRTTIRARPTLHNNWRIDPNLHGFEVEIEEANLRLGPVNTSARRPATQLARRYVERHLPDLNAAIAADPFLETAARRALGEVCRTFPVRRPDLPPIFVEVRPREAIAAQPRITAEALSLVIGVEAEIRVSDAETRPDCPFPANLRIVDPPERGPLAIVAPVELTFAAANEALRQLSGRTFEDQARGLSIDVRSVTVRPAGTRLLVSAEVTARHSGLFGRLAGPISGTVHALAEPVLDVPARRLRFRNVELDVASREPLAGVLGGAGAALIEATLTDAMSIDLGRELDRFNASAAAAASALAERREGVRLELAIERTDLEALAFDSERLRITARVTGTVRAAVVDLPLP